MERVASWGEIKWKKGRGGSCGLITKMPLLASKFIEIPLCLKCYNFQIVVSILKCYQSYFDKVYTMVLESKTNFKIRYFVKEKKIWTLKQNLKFKILSNFSYNRAPLKEV